MRYYLDTEFDETPDRLVLISLALRAQDGRELNLVANDVNPDDCNPWVRANVWPYLAVLPVSYVGSPSEFPQQIKAFVADDSGPEFWGYYSAYDWFLFCRLWGGMLFMPRRFPKVCYDLKQLADTLLPGVNYKDDNPPERPEHNALADARWNNRLFRWILMRADQQAERDDHHSPALRRGVDAFINDARFSPALRRGVDASISDARFSDIDKLQDEAVAAVARAAAHEGTALGIGGQLDELPEMLVSLRHASSTDFVARYGAASKALHENWTRRVGAPHYKKSVWMEVDVALSRLARAVAASIGYDGPWERVVTTVPRPARAGDVYRFTYENESQFNKTLLVERTLGDGPDDLVFFEDHSHSKQRDLGLLGAERISP